MPKHQPGCREELRRRMRAMMLELSCFEMALVRGQAEAVSYSAGAPTFAPELGRWMRTVEAVHDGLISLQRGWERLDDLNQPTWVNRAQSTALVVSSGDDYTGDLTPREPSNRNPKGKTFGALVTANEQLALFDIMSDVEPLPDIRETWVLLYNARDGFVYSELSLPVRMPKSRIEKWADRILMPRLDMSTNKFEPADEGESGQDFNFTIRRR